MKTDSVNTTARSVDIGAPDKRLVTVSRVLFSGTVAEPERQMLRKWAEWAAGNGGAFSIKQEWTENQWYTTYTIHWPENAEAAAAAIGRAM